MKRIILICFAILFPAVIFAQQTISGRVTDESGSTMPGTNVYIKSTFKGTTTDLDGFYTISVNSTDTVVFSMVGFNRLEIIPGNRTTIDIVLKTSSRQLDEVVVIGYGTSKSRDLTAPIVTIKSEEISRQTTANPAQALQGKMAGVTVTNSGEPGSAPQIRIRGVGTALATGSGPLYIVDGIVVSNISFLNNNDIESLSVLKDASAGAIYGVQAANGVVLITTKKGKIGEPQFNFSAYAGVQHATNLVKMANTTQYIELLNQRSGLTGAGNTFDPTNFPVSTQWYKALLRNPFISNVEFNVSGGGEKNLYSFGISHFYQDGLIETKNKNNHYDRINFRAKNDYTFNSHISGGFGLIFSRSLNIPTNNYALFQAYVTPPAFGPKNPDGTWSDPTALGFSGPFANPAASVYYYDDRTEEYSMLPNAYLALKFNDDLTFKTTFSGDIGFSLQRNYTPTYYVSGLQSNKTSNLAKNNNFRKNIIWDNTLDYSKTVGKSDFKFMVGSSIQEFYDTYLSGTRYNVPYLSDATLFLTLGDDGTQRASDGGNKSRVASFFTRVGYSFNSKYLITGTFRADGSSKYANNQWGYFPSVGLGWILSNENFLKDNTYINFLKIRASWGKLGNSNVPANSSVTYGGPVDGGIFGGNNYIPGLTFSTVIKSPLKWEVIEEYDAGFEVYAFHNRMNLEVDYYTRVTNDAVFNAPVPGITGTDNLLGNNGKIQNNGLELVLGWTDQTEDGKIKYNVSANFATIHNEVLEINNQAGVLYGPQLLNGSFITRTIKGKPIGSFYGYDVVGVFQSNADIDDYKSANGTILQPDAIPGDLKFANTNGDDIINGDDRTYLGSPVPKYTLGLNGGVTYGSWDISIAIQGVAGNKLFNFKRANRNAFPDANYDYDFYQNHWDGKGSSSVYPSAALTRKNIQPNSFFVESGSYIRIRSLQFGYTISEKIAKKVAFKSARVYLNAQNPLTIFGYNGFTPEIGGRPTSTGIDESTYPLSSIYTFGINASF